MLYFSIQNARGGPENQGGLTDCIVDTGCMSTCAVYMGHAKYVREQHVTPAL